MTKLFPAAVVMLATLLAGCGSKSSSSDVTGVASDPSKPTNATPAAAPPVTEPVSAAQTDAALEFQKRLQVYMKTHNDAEAKVPNLKSTDDPQKIADREKALGEMIMTMRAGAQPGEIFAPEFQPYFIQIVRDDFAARSAADRKALINELPKNMKVDINTVYPTTLPLATFPPALLRKLPDLPAEMEYRIVGRSLILRDAKANLIVDILRDVVPTIPS
jgi:hypothetical protein